MQQHKNNQPVSVSKDVQRIKQHGECQGYIENKVQVCLGVEVRFKILSERGNRGGCINLSGNSFSKQID